jgi:Tol biopolymer transport system component/DNA-binding winged helix-turn-helix (wHTH) protein
MNLRVSLKRETDELLNQPNVRLRVGDHVVDLGALRVLTRPDQPRLTSKAAAVLLELVRQAGDTVTRDQLLERVWKGRCPTPDVLNQAIKELRRAFADDAKPSQYVETIPKVGYRLVAPVLFLNGPDGSLLVEGTDASELGADDARDIGDEPPRNQAMRRVSLRMLLALGLIAVAAVLAYAVDRYVRAPTATAAWKATALRVLTSDPGSEVRPHISPDGTRAAFGVLDPKSNLDRIVVRAMDASQRVQLTTGSDRHEAMPVWSPDGTRIAFERLNKRDCDMYVASSLGGDERTIGTCHDFNVNYYDWSPDGRGLLTAAPPVNAAGALSLLRWNLDTGQREYIAYERKAGDEDLEPRYSPDGHWIAFRRGVAPYSDLYVMPAAGGAVRQVTHLASRIRGYSWVRDNRTLVLSSDHSGEPALYSVDVEHGALAALGVAPAQYPDIARAADEAVYEIPRTHSQVTHVPLANGGAQREVIASSTGSDFAAALSPDGARIVFVSDRGGKNQLWLHDRATNTTTALTDKSDTGFAWPRLSHDGTHAIAIERDAAGRRLIEVDISSRRVRVLGGADENALFGLYGVDDDSYVLAVGPSVRDNRLFLLQHPGTPQATRRELASGVAHAEVDAVTRSIYYTTSKKPGLYMLGIDDGSERFVSEKVTPVTMDGWRIVDGKVWYLTGLDEKPTALHELDPATSADREVAVLDLNLRDQNFSVTPARDAIVVTPAGTDDTDIGAFRLVRASAL